MTIVRSFSSLPVLAISVFLFIGGALEVAFSADAHSLETLYGEGVYAFNNKDYATAVRVFNTMESQGSADPRGYFYRGLSQFRLGNQDMAAKDYDYAASLELSQAGRPYSVPKALEKIQGRERLSIEKFRREAKKKWNEDQAKLKKDEFDVQKKRDLDIYNTIIQQGTAAQPPEETKKGAKIPVPFGAKAITPFDATMTSANETPLDQVPAFTEDNIFKAEIDKKVVLPENRKKVSRSLVIQRPEKHSDDFELGEDATDDFGSDFASVFQGGQQAGTSGNVDDFQNIFDTDDNAVSSEDLVDPFGMAESPPAKTRAPSAPAKNNSAPVEDKSDPFGDGSDPFDDTDDPFGDAKSPPAKSPAPSVPAKNNSAPVEEKSDPFGDGSDPFDDTDDPFEDVKSPPAKASAPSAPAKNKSALASLENVKTAEEAGAYCERIFAEMQKSVKTPEDEKRFRLEYGPIGIAAGEKMIALSKNDETLENGYKVKLAALDLLSSERPEYEAEFNALGEEIKKLDKFPKTMIKWRFRSFYRDTQKMIDSKSVTNEDFAKYKKEAKELSVTDIPHDFSPLEPLTSILDLAQIIVLEKNQPKFLDSTLNELLEFIQTEEYAAHNDQSKAEKGLRDYCRRMSDSFRDMKSPPVEDKSDPFADKSDSFGDKNDSTPKTPVQVTKPKTPVASREVSIIPDSDVDPFDENSGFDLP